MTPLRQLLRLHLRWGRFFLCLAGLTVYFGQFERLLLLPRPPLSTVLSDRFVLPSCHARLLQILHHLDRCVREHLCHLCQPNVFGVPARGSEGLRVI